MNTDIMEESVPSPGLDSSHCEKSLIGDKTESSTTESTTRLITTPPANISIGHLYVYNFSSARKGNPSIEIPIPSKKYGKTQSPAASSGPFCRICHEGDTFEDLISPCLCSGTVGLVHLTCIEKWLSLAGSDRCEICKYVFAIMRSPKSFSEWIKTSSSDSEIRRSFVSDLLCFFLLTPLAGVSSFLCVEGAKKQVYQGNSLEAGCLMALATFLVTIYFIWNMLTCKFHLKNYLTWRSVNQNVKVIRVHRLPSTDSESPRRAHQRNSTSSGGNTTEITLHIPDVSPS